MLPVYRNKAKRKAPVPKEPVQIFVLAQVGMEQHSQKFFLIITWRWRKGNRLLEDAQNRLDDGFTVGVF